MYPHAKRFGEITGETSADLRAPVEGTGGSSFLNSEHSNYPRRRKNDQRRFKVEGNFKYVWLGTYKSRPRYTLGITVGVMKMSSSVWPVTFVSALKSHPNRGILLMNGMPSVILP